MKKLLFCIVCFLLIERSNGQSSPAPGRLKISIENFTCINKSWDGTIELDGHGNEVSVNCSYRIYNPANPQAARKGVVGTPIFGSNVNGMTRAGTQTPDLGGIKNGDVINVSRPIMDEHINANEYIIIAPTLWEWDVQGNNIFNSFNAQLEMDLNWVTTQTYPFTNTSVSFNQPFNGRVIKIYDKYPYGQATKYHSIFKDFLCPLLGQGTRPVDVRAGTFNNQCMVIYPPTLLVLDTRNLSALAANNASAAQHSAGRLDRPDYINGLTISFTENNYTLESNNGKYTVFFKIEFIPDILPVDNPTPTPTPTPSKTVPVKKALLVDGSINIASSSVSIPGTWTGTFGYGDSDTPNFYSIIFNADGTMQLIDNVGVIQARGSYTFNQQNRDLTATYNYLSGERFDFSGTLNSNIIKAEWWKSKDTNLKGKLVLYKK